MNELFLNESNRMFVPYEGNGAKNCRSLLRWLSFNIFVFQLKSTDFRTLRRTGIHLFCSLGCSQLWIHLFINEWGSLSYYNDLFFAGNGSFVFLFWRKDRTFFFKCLYLILHCVCWILDFYCLQYGGSYSFKSEAFKRKRKPSPLDAGIFSGIREFNCYHLCEANVLSVHIKWW